MCTNHMLIQLKLLTERGTPDGGVNVRVNSTCCDAFTSSSSQRMTQPGLKQITVRRERPREVSDAPCGNVRGRSRLTRVWAAYRSIFPATCNALIPRIDGCRILVKQMVKYPMKLGGEASPIEPRAAPALF
jgi:hypothetical protein